MFYKTQHLTLEQKKNIIYKAKEVCYRYRIDILDCKKSFYREPINMSFEEIMAKFNDRCHFTIIHREESYDRYLEVAFSTFSNPDYFLWIFLDPKYISEVFSWA